MLNAITSHPTAAAIRLMTFYEAVQREYMMTSYR